jgi:hypothetical protein
MGALERVGAHPIRLVPSDPGSVSVLQHVVNKASAMFMASEDEQ